jgi:LacI family transcriptional regulator
MASTVKEIAKKANVSVATVSRALNNDNKVKAETKKIILSLAKELNYTPNIIARNFVKRRSTLIGLILPEVSDEFFTEIIKGVDEVSYNEGFYTIVTSSHKYESLEDEIITFIRSGLLSGLVLLVSDLGAKLKTVLLESHIPVVLINSNPNIKKFDTISVNNYKSAFEITRYLITKKKFIRLAHITGPSKNDDSLFRKTGFIDACKKYGAKYAIEEGDFTREGGSEACRKVLKRTNRPQAIFASNDMMAIGCYDLINKLGLKIPEDIGVVGFDDIFVSQYLTPPLTTVRTHIEDIGKKAAELLIKRIKNKIKPSIVKVNATSELIIRKSC